MQKIIVGRDIDGVEQNLIDPFDSLMESYGRNLILPTSFNLDKRYQDTTFQEAWQFLKYFIEEKRAFLNIPYYPGANKSGTKLNQEVKNYVITARTFSSQAIQDTYDRLTKECNLSEKQIFIEKNKGPLAKALGITDFLEDSLENANEIIYYTKARIHLINQTYNQLKKNQKDHPNIIRHNSFSQAIEYILELKQIIQKDNTTSSLEKFINSNRKTNYYKIFQPNYFAIF